jgi:hypothetical protein
MKSKFGVTATEDNVVVARSASTTVVGGGREKFSSDLVVTSTYDIFDPVSGQFARI